MSQVNNYPYKTEFGSKYDVLYKGKLDKTGDFEAVSFAIDDEKQKPNKEVIIKISGTLISVWNVASTELENTLFKLGIAKIFILLENEEVIADHEEFMFSTYGVSKNAQNELDRLENELNGLREMHRKWIERTRESYLENNNLITKIQKDHADFQGENARELRTSMLQLSSVSAAIIGAVVALGSDKVSNNIWTLVALVFLSLSTCIPFVYSTIILENIILNTFKKFKDISGRLEKINESQFKFLRNPDVIKHNEIDELWEINSSEIKANIKEIDSVKKDSMLSIIQIFFTLGIICLIISFAANILKTNEKVKSYQNMDDKELITTTIYDLRSKEK